MADDITKIAEIMKKDCLVLDADDTVAYAAKAMSDRKFAEAPVISQKRYAGMILMSKIASLLVRRSLLGHPIKNDMKKVRNNPVSKYTVRPWTWLGKDADILSAIVLLARRDMEIIPVVDSGMRMVGVVHACDVRREIAKMLAEGKPVARAQKKDEGDENSGGRTAIDNIVNYVQKKGSASAEEVAQGCGLTVQEVEDYATSLEKRGLLKLEYSIIGKMKLKAP